MGTTQILEERCHLGVQLEFRARQLIEKNTNHLGRHPFGAVEVDQELLHAYLQEITHHESDSWNLRRSVHLPTSRTTESRFMQKVNTLLNGSSLKVQQTVRNKRWIQCSAYGTTRSLSIWRSKMEFLIVKFTKNNQNTNLKWHHNSEAKRKLKIQTLQSYKLT